MNLAVRNGTPLSCLMIDIDHFKAINDSYGHEAGDTVIKSVAAIIQRAVRDIGMAFRYGGEEFWCCWVEPMNSPRWSARTISITACTC